MGFWDNIGKFKDRGNTEPDMDQQKVEENLEKYKSEREKFLESLRVELNDTDEISKSDTQGEDPDSDDDMGETDDIDNDIGRDGPERSGGKVKDDDDDYVR